MTAAVESHADMFADDDGGLFDMKPTASALLRDRYQEPPFTVLDRRSRAWIDRDKKWKAIGIQSEVGRGDALTYNMPMSYSRPDGPVAGQPESVPQTSVFSPTLCELVYRWYSAPGARVLDPFAGGSVRGVVASALGRWYTGVDLRAEQVEANRAQAHLGGDITPEWLTGTSADVRSLVDPAFEADLLFSCPPYAYLERYSDDPADLSTMSYPDFLDTYRHIIAESAALLRPDRFAAWVVGEVRERGGDGSCLGLIPDTVQAFRDAGLDLYNDHIILTPIGTAAVRTPKQWDASRKAGRVHEYLLVFVKGNAKRATAYLRDALQRPTTDLDDDVADATGGTA